MNKRTLDLSRLTLWLGAVLLASAVLFAGKAAADIGDPVKIIFNEE